MGLKGLPVGRCPFQQDNTVKIPAIFDEHFIFLCQNQKTRFDEVEGKYFLISSVRTTRLPA